MWSSLDAQSCDSRARLSTQRTCLLPIFFHRHVVGGGPCVVLLLPALENIHKLNILKYLVFGELMVLEVCSCLVFVLKFMFKTCSDPCNEISLVTSILICTDD